MIIGPLIRRKGCYFVLIQSNQKSSRQKCFFAHRAFALQTGQNHGLESFALLAFAPVPCFSKISYARSAQTHHRSARFRPKLFCRQRRIRKILKITRQFFLICHPDSEGSNSELCLSKLHVGYRCFTIVQHDKKGFPR
jgi:hypothetical protein